MTNPGAVSRVPAQVYPGPGVSVVVVDAYNRRARIPVPTHELPHTVRERLGDGPMVVEVLADLGAPSLAGVVREVTRELRVPRDAEVLGQR